MKLKHSIISWLCVLFLAGCSESFFEQYPSNNITEGNHYQSDGDFNQGVRACYAKLKTGMGFHLTELAFRSDESTLESMAVSTQDRYDIDHFIESSNNGIMESIWDAWYNGIYRCNDVLGHLEGVDIPNKNQYKGELLFLRAWWYFNLYRSFGVVPIAREVVTPAAAKLVPRCTQEEMYTLLVEDLSQAAELLPSIPNEEKARVSSMAAYTLLGKVHLTFHRPQDAKLALEKAMENPNYGLMPSTKAVFDVENKMNREIIFALYYNKTNDNGHGCWYTTNTTNMADIMNPTQKFKQIYSDIDNRKALINSYTKVSSNLYVMNKWYDTYDPVYTTQVGNDFPHLRYADVVLMYAEAIVDSDLMGAVEWLNKIRTRAGLTALSSADVTDKETFIKELAEERAREFALEGHRWFDLVRLGLAVDYFRSIGLNIDEHNLLFPIPQSQIEIVNDPAILWQNPGF